MNTSEATRQILWNVENPLNSVIMYGLMVLSLIVAGIGIWRHVELWRSGKQADEHWGRWSERFYDLFAWGGMQKGVVRETSAAIFHTLIYFGFLVLLFTTTMVFIDHDLGIRIYHGDFYLWVTIFSDVFGLGVLIGCLLAIYRRSVKKVDRLHTRFADHLVLGIIVLLIAQGFLLEGLRIHVTNDPWARYSPVGRLVAQFFWQLSEPAARSLHFFAWWFHTITVFSAIALLPYTKFLHILASSINLFFRRRNRPKGALENPGDLATLMESGEEFSIGLGTIKDYNWKQLMDLDACTSCGRCQAVCPAYESGKPLSPKWIVLDTRNHALTLQAKGAVAPSLLPKPLAAMDSALTTELLLSSSGLRPAADGAYFEGSGAFRAANPLVQQSVLKIGENAEARIAGDVIDPEAFWSCTTCMACVEACPVGIQHVDQIVGNRRNMALMQGEIPSEAQKTLRAIETRGNPYGPAEHRTAWLGDLKVPILKPGDSVDYLYWVGCVSAYDQRKQKIARALVTIMQKAGLSFGILGNAEGCSGDPARRLGEENLFQTMAKSNIELLRSLQFKTLVANCPHCFNTIKNEYPQFGNLADGAEPEIIHHSVLLRRLLSEEKLTLKASSEQFTFHDPCYLGRYNDEYEAPRAALKKVKGLQILEMDRSREKAMCCGAGGGHFWMDMKVGERVNTIRTEQAAATGANNIATACPFCLQMMEDGTKLTNREDTLRVKDIAEVIAENLVG